MARQNRKEGEESRDYFRGDSQRRRPVRVSAHVWYWSAGSCSSEMSDVSIMTGSRSSPGTRHRYPPYPPPAGVRSRERESSALGCSRVIDQREARAFFQCTCLWCWTPAFSRFGKKRKERKERLPPAPPRPLHPQTARSTPAAQRAALRGVRGRPRGRRSRAVARLPLEVLRGAHVNAPVLVQQQVEVTVVPARGVGRPRACQG